MPKIIVTSTFRKGGGAGKKGGAGGLLKYMGTREGVERLPLSQANSLATKRQKNLIESVLKQIPKADQYPEYQEFLEAGTKGAANAFMNTILKQKEDAEKISKLVTYMAERPGVVKLGKHGLFSQTDYPIDLDNAAEEVANHEGYIWTHIVSLHREDAERLGYASPRNGEELRNPDPVTYQADYRRYPAETTNAHIPPAALCSAAYQRACRASRVRKSAERSLGQDGTEHPYYHPLRLRKGSH